MALGSVLTERYEATQPAITMETWSMLLGAIFLHIAVFAQPDVAIDSARWTDTVLAMVLYLSVFSSAVAYFIYFYLLEQLGPFEMNFIAYAAAAFSARSLWLGLAFRGYYDCDDSRIRRYSRRIRVAETRSDPERTRLIPDATNLRLRVFTSVHEKPLRREEPSVHGLSSRFVSSRSHTSHSTAIDRSYPLNSRCSFGA